MRSETNGKKTTISRIIRLLPTEPACLDTLCSGLPGQGGVSMEKNYVFSPVQFSSESQGNFESTKRLLAWKENALTKSTGSLQVRLLASSITSLLYLAET